MGATTRHTATKSVWQLEREQHGVISAGQLRGCGLTAKAIRHRVLRGRLHPVMRGVYAVGRPEIDRRGRWMAAVLACGPAAAISHWSAAALWGIRPEPSIGAAEVRATAATPAVCTPIDVSVRTCSHRDVAGVRVHRRAALRESDVVRHKGIPVTTATMTLIDLAAGLGERALERAVNEADRLDLVDPATLLESLDHYTSREGVGRLRRMLTEQVFLLTDSELERRFLRLVRHAKLPLPQTGGWLNGYRVDFHWPDLGLVVETDGLRYHRTPAQQARDNRRDQTHTAAGLTPLRFSHAEVRFDRRKVEEVLRRTIERLRVEAALARRRGTPWPPQGANGGP